jgi:hypothetical protein
LSDALNTQRLGKRYGLGLSEAIGCGSGGKRKACDLRGDHTGQLLSTGYSEQTVILSKGDGSEGEVLEEGM